MDGIHRQLLISILRRIRGRAKRSFHRALTRSLAAGTVQNVEVDEIPTRFLKPPRPELITKACRRRVLVLLAPLVQLNLDAMTGHYRLSLNQPADYSAADRMWLAGRWEASIAAERKLVDTTQAGHHLGFRNVLLDEKLELIKPSWQVPGDGLTGAGVLQFDYASPIYHSKRHACTPLEPAQLEMLVSFLAGWEGTDISMESRLQAFRAVAHRFYVDALQMRRLIHAMPSQGWRCEVFVTVFPRCLDFGAPTAELLNDHELWKSCVHAQQLLTQRLGLTLGLDALNIHEVGRNKWRYELHWRDARICVNFLMKLRAKEDPATLEAQWEGGGGKNTKQKSMEKGKSSTAKTDKASRNRSANVGRDAEAMDVKEQAMVRFIQLLQSKLPKKDGKTPESEERNFEIPNDFATPMSGVLTVTYSMSDLKKLRLERRKQFASELLGWVVTQN